MLPNQRPCSECGEPIDGKRLLALPNAQLCVDCANIDTSKKTAIAPPKVIESKPIATTTIHLKRYLVNVGQKSEDKALFRTLVRVNYLFPNISVIEMTKVFIDWSKRTKSPFDQEQIRKLIVDAQQWVKDHPNRANR